LLERLRAGSQAMPAWAALTKQAARVEPALLRLRELLDDLGRRRTVNTRWLNWGLGLGLLFMIVFIPKSFGVWPPYAMSAAGLSVIAWRLLPLWQLMGQLRELGQTLPTQARASE
jgi:MFS superfamily sulfate permease-like transporter